MHFYSFPSILSTQVHCVHQEETISYRSNAVPKYCSSILNDRLLRRPCAPFRFIAFASRQDLKETF